MCVGEIPTKIINLNISRTNNQLVYIYTYMQAIKAARTCIYSYTHPYTYGNEQRPNTLYMCTNKFVELGCGVYEDCNSIYMYIYIHVHVYNYIYYIRTTYAEWIEDHTQDGTVDRGPHTRRYSRSRTTHKTVQWIEDHTQDGTVDRGPHTRRYSGSRTTHKTVQ